MADVNVNVPTDQAPTMAPPTRTDDQILPHIRWMPIEKINCYLDIERDALQITPVNNNKAFSSPSSSDALINFVNDLGYPKVVRNLSNVVTNDMFQPWRALTTIINLCLTGKTSGFERPRAPVFTKLIIHYLHKSYPRPDSPLHLPNEEHVLAYLKFSAKGTKREVFGMPIPSNLITSDIQGEPYYKEYLEKVAKHQRYLAGEKGSDPDSPALKHAKATKKSKPSAPKADLRPPVTKSASSQQPEPKPAPAKSQGKKRKLVTETSDKPYPARRSKLTLVTKRCKPTSSLRSIDKSVDEGILEKEPRFNDEDADVQRALEESLKSVYDAPRGPLPLVVVREPESRKYQPLLEVQGKGIEKVTDEQVSLDLLTLQTPKKKSPADQFIFQRRTSTPTQSSGRDESSSLYAELGLTDSEAGPNPSDAAASQPQSSHVVHAGPNLKHMDLEATDVSIQPHPEQMDEGFTATAYPKVQENLKLTVEEHVILEEPASSTRTLSSLQHLAKDLSFGDLDLPEADMKEIIHQRMWQSNSYKTHEDHMMLYEALEKSMIRDHTDELLKDLAEAHKKKKKRRDSPKTPHGSPPHQPLPPSPPAAPSSSKTAASAEYKAWIMTDIRIRLSVSSTSKDLHMDDDMAPDAQAYSSDDEDIGNAHIPTVNLRQDWWKPLEEDRPATPEPTWSIPSYDVPVPKNNWASALASTYSPPPEDSLLSQTDDMAMFKDWFVKDKESLNSNHKTWKALHLNLLKSSILIKPLPLGGPPSQVTIQSDFFFNKDLEYLRYGSKGSRPALSISKMKETYYPDTQLNLTKPQWDATGFEYKHDYIVIDSPRAVTFRDKYGVQMIMRFNEIYKFSDGTLHQIDAALDYRVKEFKVNRMNSGLNTRFWTRKDVDRSKEFMFAIQKWLKTKRIFCNLESFVGGRVRDGDSRLLKHTK
nr:E-beta-farnesene synthase [Tanacetum cinerariifolium]